MSPPIFDAWELDEALAFLRRLERHMKPRGFHVALTGGVLRKGRSKKDLDVVLYPRTKLSDGDFSHPAHALVSWRDLAADALRDFGLRRTHTAERLQQIWLAKGSADKKHVEVWVRGRGRRMQRVDVMLLD